MYGFNGLRRPLSGFRIISITSFAVHLAAFIMLLLVGLSLPIIDSVYLISLRAAESNQPPTTIATRLRFGVWGVCASSVLEPSNRICTKPMLGYTIPPEYLTLIGLSTSLVNIMMTSLLAVLILHLVAAIISFVAFFVSLFIATQAAAIVGLILSIMTGLLSCLMLGVDIGLVIVVRNKVDQFTNGGFVVEYGNGVWLVIIACLLTWIGVVVLSVRTCYCCGIRRKDITDTY